MSASPQLEVHLPSEFPSPDPRPLFLATGKIQGIVHVSNIVGPPPDTVNIVLQGS